MKYLLTLGFVATVVIANWAVERFGVIPVGLGFTAPAGVYAAGIAFGLRDMLNDVGGRAWVLGAIAVGAAVSYVVGDGITLPGGLVALAVASAVAFGLSELADLAVYEPVRQRSWWPAVALSNVVGAVVDSALFLWLAFGSLDHLQGQVWGKALMIAPVVAVMWGLRSRALLPRHP